MKSTIKSPRLHHSCSSDETLQVARKAVRWLRMRTGRRFQLESGELFLITCGSLPASLTDH